VEIGAPLLVVVRVMRDQSDCPVEHIRALYRPDLYEFQMSMSREAGKGAMRWETGHP
jgi:GntR family transcriptional regulator